MEETLNDQPVWYATAVLGAVLAALGYVAKLILDWLGQVNERRRSRRAQLAELHSLLQAGRSAFLTQVKHRNHLLGMIEERDPQLAQMAAQIGYDRVIATAYPNMTPEETELHGLIRTITEHTLRPLNESLLDWLNKDNYFKAKRWGHGLKTDLAESLARLHVHLLLWMAKYEVWIPDAPQNSLVYLDDEQEHGTGFPQELQGYVEAVLQKWWLFGA